MRFFSEETIDFFSEQTIIQNVDVLDDIAVDLLFPGELLLKGLLLVYFVLSAGEHLLDPWIPPMDKMENQCWLSAGLLGLGILLAFDVLFTGIVRAAKALGGAGPLAISIPVVPHARLQGDPVGGSGGGGGAAGQPQGAALVVSPVEQEEQPGEADQGIGQADGAAPAGGGPSPGRPRLRTPRPSSWPSAMAGA